MASFAGMRYSELLGAILSSATERTGLMARLQQRATNGT
ncbi:MAG: hypothetical protein RLZ98_3048 [Pseudomonadota bacterium]|jgi:hypothetical protein